MSRRRPADEDLLFDLPLERPPAAPEPPAAPGPPPPAEPPPVAAIEQPGLPLTEEEEKEEGGRHPVAETVVEAEAHQAAPAGAAPARRRAADPKTAMVRLRAAAGLTDLGVCAAVLVVLLVALLAQGVQPGLSDWPAGALFLLTFSFLYAVLPLAFWGRTPGMALVGLRSTSADGRPLTFRQAVLKWLGFVLTVAGLGLPVLLAIAGRSLSDLISGSTTRTPEPPRPRRPR